ncbi:MAG: hypothetical protein ACOX6V_00215 [Patescibacteria group bacterium]
MVFLAGCQPEAGAIPTHEEVAARRVRPTPEQAKRYCEEKGGHYEDWIDEDGTKNTYCILPENYGCDPILFAQGQCGKGL